MISQSQSEDLVRHHQLNPEVASRSFLPPQGSDDQADLVLDSTPAKLQKSVRRSLQPTTEAANKEQQSQSSLPFKCEICGAGFFKPQSLGGHISKGHPKMS